MAKSYRKYKKPVVLDALSIEMEEYDLSYFFIKTRNIPEYDAIRDSMEEHFGKTDFVHQCEDDNEKEMILEIISCIQN